MNIVISDFLLDHQEELCKFIINDFADKINSMTIDYFITSNYKVTHINKDLNTFDYYWIKRDIDEIYSTTHCFLYLKEKKLKILSFGGTKEGEEHQEYVKDNIGKFEKVLQRKKYIDTLI